MTVVSDSSPLSSLAKIDSFDLLRKLYGTLVISSEVHAEVVIAGVGLAGAADTARATWIDTRQIKQTGNLTAALASELENSVQ